MLKVLTKSKLLTHQIDEKLKIFEIPSGPPATVDDLRYPSLRMGTPDNEAASIPKAAYRMRGRS